MTNIVRLDEKSTSNYVYCPHMRYKDIYRLKGKEKRSICHANINQKKTGVTDRLTAD
jgi:hypothetical protein